MTVEFLARDVALRILERLEERRVDIVGDALRVRAEVEAALEPVRREYAEAELPPGYMKALGDEVLAIVPLRWQGLAFEFTARERDRFGLWRGGDPLSRATYVLVALVIGGLLVYAPFVPIWEKWFPFAFAIASFFIPEIQTAWYRRRYERALGDIALAVGAAQPRLDAHFTTELLLGDPAPDARPRALPDGPPAGPPAPLPAKDDKPHG